MNAAPPHCCAASARWHALLIWLRPFRLSRDQRLFFLISSLVQWLGISLSGFDVHWLLYLPPAFFLGAALNGYCSMMIVTRLLLGRDRG